MNKYIKRFILFFIESFLLLLVNDNIILKSYLSYY
jgi:hypothetical protein